MAVVRETSATAVGSSTATVTLNKPAGLAVGDLMVVAINHRGPGSSPTGQPASGAWTQLALQTTTFNASANIMWRLSTAADVAAASFTWTHGDSIKWTSVIARYTGHHATSPITTNHAGVTGSVSAAALEAPAVTGAADGAVFVDWFTNNEQTTFSTVATLSKIDGTTTGGLVTGGTGTNGSSTTQGKTLTASGSTGTFTTTVGAASSQWVGYTVGIEPPDAAAGTQDIRPDADTVTTGWTATPLFSKINDSADGTVISATAA